MYEGLNSPSIHVPQTLYEYSQIAIRYPNAKVWAGGTALMSREKAYPTRENNPEIVYLNNIEELKKISRNDRMIETGATVPLFDILKNHRNFIPQILRQNIEALGSPLLSSRATIGGSIATTQPMSTLPGTLITLAANAEVRSLKKKIIKSKWFPISQLVNSLKNGTITLPSRALITRVRVSLSSFDHSYFREEGSYVDDVENTVAVAFTASSGQETLLNPHLAITFPLQGIVYSKDLDNILMQLHFPLSGTDFNQFLQIAYTFINAVTPNITRVQKARLNYILEDMINSINTKVLAPSSFDHGQGDTTHSQD